MAALNAEIQDDLKREIDVVCAQRGLKLKEVVAEALEMWLHPPLSQGDPRMEKLHAILLSGHEKAISAVTQNIELFWDHVQLVPRPLGQKKAG
jgi:hypothetical protein